MDDSKSRSTKDYPHYNIAAPAVLLSVGFIGPALSAAAVVGLYGYSTWNDVEASLAQDQLTKDKLVSYDFSQKLIDVPANSPKASSLKDLQSDLDRAQKGVGLRDDLLKIRDGDVAARDAQILVLQTALDKEKQRVGRRNEEVLRLKGIVERRDEPILELAEEKAELEVKIDEDAFYWEMAYAELEEELSHERGHPVGSEQTSETATKRDMKRSTRTPTTFLLSMKTKPDGITSAPPEELEVRQDFGYHSGADAGQPPDLIHTRQKNPVDWSRLLMLADKFPKLDPEVIAIEYQDEDAGLPQVQAPWTWNKQQQAKQYCPLPGLGATDLTKFLVQGYQPQRREESRMMIEPPTGWPKGQAFWGMGQSGLFCPPPPLPGPGQI